MKICVLGLTIFLLFVPNFSQAGEKWDNSTIALEVSWQIIHALDWGTTLDIASHPRMYEMNPILGDHPSRGTINAYMLAGAILHPIVTEVLPVRWRVWWQAITIGMSGACVINNFNAGLSIRF